MEFMQIRCQEKNCPHHKSNCCFGEICVDSVNDTPLIERHKCKYAKENDTQNVVDH